MFGYFIFFPIDSLEHSNQTQCPQINLVVDFGRVSVEVKWTLHNKLKYPSILLGILCGVNPFENT